VYLGPAESVAGPSKHRYATEPMRCMVEEINGRTEDPEHEADLYVGEE